LDRKDGGYVSNTPLVRTPTPTAQRVFHAAEIWWILQLLGAVTPEPNVPPEAGFDSQASTDALMALIGDGTLQMDAQRGVILTPETEALVRPPVFPDAVIVASVSDRGASDTPARIICFSRTAGTGSTGSVVVNWVDEKGDHHFVAYPAQDAGPCVLLHLSKVCDLDIQAPGAESASAGQAAPDGRSAPDRQTAPVGRAVPTPREVERAAEQMKQAVSLTALKGVGSPEQTAHAAGWFISAGSAWLMPSQPIQPQQPPQPPRAPSLPRDQSPDQLQAPRRASRSDIAQAVLSLAEQVLA
jgi:hypothetical protein